MLPLVISGPSGVGKSSLLRKLLSTHSSLFAFSVSSTTRSPRPGESHGRDYHFLSLEDFQSQVAAGDFLETAEVHGNKYGTHKSELRRAQETSKVLVLDIDVQGVEQLWRHEVLGNYVFVEPDSMTVLESRLRGRGTDSEEHVRSRLKQACTELQFLHSHRLRFAGVLRYDYLDTTYPRFLALLAQLYPSFSSSLIHN